MKLFPAFLISIISLFLVVQPVQAAFFRGEENITVNKPVDNDAYLGGEAVTITAPINGELLAVGANRLSISQPIGRSVVGAGQTVTIDNRIGHDGWLIGDTVTVSGEVGHDLFVAGRSVTIKEGTIIHGDLFVGAEKLQLNGTVNGRVLAGASESVTINAIIGQELRLQSGRIEFTGGEVGQNFVYGKQAELFGLDKVTINGHTEKIEPKLFLGWESENTNQASLNTGWLINLLSSLLLGSVLIKFLPKKLNVVTDMMTKEWNRSSLTGLLVLIVAPITAIILMFTQFGVKLGFIILGLYVTLLTFVSTYGLFLIGGWILAKTGDAQPNWWARLLVGAVALAIVMLIPAISWIVMVIYFLLFTLPALGASALWYRQQVK